MTHPPRTRSFASGSIIVAAVVAVAAAAVVSLLPWAPAGAAPGAQTTAVLTPATVETSTSPFSLTFASAADNPHCDGTGAENWRAHTFIVDGDVDITTLQFGPTPSGWPGIDFDGSDGTIAAPLFVVSDPRVAMLPANTPAGLIDPAQLQGFNFDPSFGWVFIDGEYQIGFICEDGTGFAQQWWILDVTIDADASPNPFMTISSTTTTTTSSSTTSSTTSSSTTTTTTSATATPTTTSLTADPAGEAFEGESVTLTANVTPAEAVGSVTFAADGTALGAPVEVSGGQALMTTSEIEVGDRTLTASFVPTDASAFSGSSTSIDYSVVAADGVATTLTLTADPPDGATLGASVTLTATVDPAVAGSVVFTDAGGVDIGDVLDGVELPLLGGDPVPATDGVATLTTADLPEGDRDLVAVFLPDDLAAFGPSMGRLDYTIGAVATTTTLPEGTTTTGSDGSDGSGGSGGSGLPRTGGGLGLLVVAGALLCVGRIALLRARSRLAAPRR